MVRLLTSRLRSEILDSEMTAQLASVPRPTPRGARSNCLAASVLKRRLWGFGAEIEPSRRRVRRLVLSFGSGCSRSITSESDSQRCSGSANAQQPRALRDPCPSTEAFRAASHNRIVESTVVAGANTIHFSARCFAACTRPAVWAVKPTRGAHIERARPARGDKGLVSQHGTVGSYDNGFVLSTTGTSCIDRQSGSDSGGQARDQLVPVASARPLVPYREHNANKDLAGRLLDCKEVSRP